MKLKVIVKDAEIIKVASEPINDRNGNYTGYDWHKVMIAQGFESETLTVDKSVVNLIKAGSKADLVMDIFNDQQTNKLKFKISGVVGATAPKEEKK